MNSGTRSTSDFAPNDEGARVCIRAHKCYDRRLKADPRCQIFFVILAPSPEGAIDQHPSREAIHPRHTQLEKTNFYEYEIIDITYVYTGGGWGRLLNAFKTGNPFLGGNYLDLVWEGI